MPEADGKYRGPFCTGHTFFPMTAVNFYTETLNHEFQKNFPKEIPRRAFKNEPLTNYT